MGRKSFKSYIRPAVRGVAKTALAIDKGILKARKAVAPFESEFNNRTNDLLSVAGIMAARKGIASRGTAALVDAAAVEEITLGPALAGLGSEAAVDIAAYKLARPYMKRILKSSDKLNDKYILPGLAKLRKF